MTWRSTKTDHIHIQLESKCILYWNHCEHACNLHMCFSLSEEPAAAWNAFAITTSKSLSQCCWNIAVATVLYVGICIKATNTLASIIITHIHIHIVQPPHTESVCYVRHIWIKHRAKRREPPAITHRHNKLRAQTVYTADKLRQLTIEKHDDGTLYAVSIKLVHIFSPKQLAVFLFYYTLYY